MNSRQKGKRGELEFVTYLKARGIEARRGQQFAGGPDSPDVVCRGLPSVHWEVKRKEAGNPYDWLEQAHADSIGSAVAKLPVVAHRRNNREWMAILSMEDFIALLQTASPATLQQIAKGHRASTPLSSGAELPGNEAPVSSVPKA